MNAQREQLFAEPQPYFDAQKPVGNQAAVDRTELDRLRGAVAEAEAAAAKLTDWTERTRAEGHAKSLAHELQSAEFNARLVQQGDSTPPRRAGQAANQPTPGYAISDCGTAYIYVANTKPQRTAVVVGGQQFLEPTPPVSRSR